MKGGLLLAAAACSGGVAPIDSPEPPTTLVAPAPSPEDVVVEQSTLIPTVHRISFTTDVPADSYVEYATDDGVWSRTPTAPHGTEHEHVLLGLKAGHAYTWRAVAVRDGRTTATPDEGLEVPDAPPEVPRFRVERLGEVEQERFFVLFNNVGHTHSYAIVIDQDGDLVWWATTTEGPGRNVVMTKPSRDGRHIWIAQFDKSVADEGGGILKVPIAAMSGDERRVTLTDEGHHDFVELPDQRTLAFLSHEYFELAAGTGDEVLVQADVVLETALGNDGTRPVRRVFAMADDYGEPWSRSCHHHRPQMHLGRLMTEWGHANSLSYDPEEDAYFVGLRNLDQVLKVPRSGGAPAWRLGGEGSAFTLADPANWFEHAHFSQMNGEHLAVFSNELHAKGSRLLAYAVDQEAMTLTTEFVYEEPAGGTVLVLGDLDRLPGGHYLAAWGGLSKIEEIGPDGTVRWRATADPPVTIGRVTALPSLYPPP